MAPIKKQYTSKRSSHRGGDKGINSKTNDPYLDPLLVKMKKQLRHVPTLPPRNAFGKLIKARQYTRRNRRSRV
jgi:hypothetical protein